MDKLLTLLCLVSPYINRGRLKAARERHARRVRCAIAVQRAFRGHRGRNAGNIVRFAWWSIMALRCQRVIRGMIGRCVCSAGSRFCRALWVTPGTLTHHAQHSNDRKRRKLHLRRIEEDSGILAELGRHARTALDEAQTVTDTRARATWCGLARCVTP